MRVPVNSDDAATFLAAGLRVLGIETRLTLDPSGGYRVSWANGQVDVGLEAKADSHDGLCAECVSLVKQLAVARDVCNQRLVKQLAVARDVCNQRQNELCQTFREGDKLFTERGQFRHERDQLRTELDLLRVNLHQALHAGDQLRIEHDQLRLECDQLRLERSKLRFERDQQGFMKVIRKSNFNHEDHRGNQYFVAQHIGERGAKAVADLLNELSGPNNDDYYVAVADNYVLPPDFEP